MYLNKALLAGNLEKNSPCYNPKGMPNGLPKRSTMREENPTPKDKASRGNLGDWLSLLK
jgi:hypothetical protein